MNRSLPVRLLATGLAGWALVASAGLAVAQDSNRPARDKPAGAPLGGPAVRDAGIPGEKRSFANTGKSPRDRMESRGVPARVFMQAINVIRGDQVGEGARLTAGQEELIRAVQADFQSSMKSYMDAHRDEVSALRSQLSPESRAKFDQRTRAAGLGGPGGPEGRAGKAKRTPDGRPAKKGGAGADHPAEEMDAPGKPAPGAPGSAGNDEAVKRRLVELMEAAPKAKDAQAKVMSALSEPQKALVKTEIERLRKKGEQDRSPGAAAAPGTDMPALPENARERLKNMTPEQREEAMKRLRERRGQGQGGQAKPAPGIDEVDVPAPEREAPPKKRRN